MVVCGRWVGGVGGGGSVLCRWWCGQWASGRAASGGLEGCKWWLGHMQRRRVLRAVVYASMVIVLGYSAGCLCHLLILILLCVCVCAVMCRRAT